MEGLFLKGRAHLFSNFPRGTRLETNARSCPPQKQGLRAGFTLICGILMNTLCGCRPGAEWTLSMLQPFIFTIY